MASFLAMTGWVHGTSFHKSVWRIMLKIPYGQTLTYGAIAMILTAVVIWYVLNRTAFGRHVYATGDDDEAARLAGINTRGVFIAVCAEKSKYALGLVSSPVS